MSHQLDDIVKLAVLAVGGQGGGVLNSWIVDLAESNGWAVQATSVAGVAQRTGATIYYIEMLPNAPDPQAPQPVFALAPAEQDVDILIAAEWMEAGRAMMRRFVTADRTVLIASSHRALAVLEKTAPADAIADDRAVLEAAEKMSARLVAFDMEEIAQQAGSVISASLFGALAGSGALPFPASSYEETIRKSGRGVEASLAAFQAARERAEKGGVDLPQPAKTAASAPRFADGPKRLLTRWQALEARITDMPAAVQKLAHAGLVKLVDYQDLDYGAAYLDQLAGLHDLDKAAGGADREWLFTQQAAKYLANALCYDDIIRVADLKSRAPRWQRIEEEMSARPENLLQVTEYVHPGAAEFISLMPAGLGRAIEKRPALVRFIDRRVNKGRRVRSDQIGGFLMFWMLGGLRGWRRKLLRHAVETAHIEGWLEAARSALAKDYDLAVAILRARRLIKGYSDTHTRGLGKFDKVMSGAGLLAGRKDAAEWTERLIRTALADPKGEELDGALQTVRSFATDGQA